MTFHRAPDEPLAEEGTALHALLSDAAAPARPDELVGMSQAVTWFAAHTPSQTSRRSRMPALLAALVATKTAFAATAATAAVGAVTLAGATGTLPAPAQEVAHSAFGAPAADRTEKADKPAQPEKADKAKDGERVDTASSPSASPSPNLVGLCRAYTSGVKDSSGKALENPAFTVLVTAAGGAEGVDAFCVTTLAAAPGKPTDAPSGKPADAGRPSHAGKPSDAGRPTDVGRPTDAGKPAEAGRP